MGTIPEGPGWRTWHVSGGSIGPPGMTNSLPSAGPPTNRIPTQRMLRLYLWTEPTEPTRGWTRDLNPGPIFEFNSEFGFLYRTTIVPNFSPLPPDFFSRSLPFPPALHSLPIHHSLCCVFIAYQREI